MVPLGELLTKSEEWITLEPDRRYREVTVRLWGRGVIQRREVTGAAVAASRRLVARSQQFILSRIDARNGAFGLVPDSLDGAIVSNDFPTFKPNLARIAPSFLEWMSKTRWFMELCKAASEGTTNRVRLVEERFLVAKVPLPPLGEQQRIVARIDRLAARIDEVTLLRREVIEYTKAFSRSAARHVFRLGVQGREVRLENVCADIIDNLHSNPRYADEGIPCVRSPDVSWGKLQLDAALRTSEEEYARRTVRGEPRTGDVVLVREGGGTGKAAIVEEGHRFSLGQRVMLLRPDRNVVLPRFLLHQMLSPLIYEDQVLASTKGSASPHLNIAALRKFTVIVPSPSEQRRVVTFLDALQMRIDAITKLHGETAAELDALLPSVLDRAFRGEL